MLGECSMKLPDPATVVQRQLDAYNLKHIDALLATYSEHAEQFILNGERIARGHEEIRERMLIRFAEPDLHAQLVGRLVMGQTVVDLEKITRNFPEGKGSVEMICIYEVVGSHIAKASFATGAMVLEG